MTEQALCELCGEPMPAGEDMFKFHGYSGPCPKPPLPTQDLLTQQPIVEVYFEEGGARVVLTAGADDRLEAMRPGPVKLFMQAVKPPSNTKDRTMSEREWQDIESSPRDGTRFLVWYEEFGARVEIGRWGTGGVASRFYVESMEDNVKMYPAFWMPLPPPPSLMKEV